MHSPNPLDDGLRAAVAALGPVRHLVCPNRFHHLGVEAWKAAFPDALLWGVPGLPEKRKDLSFDRVLGDEPPADWAGQLDQCLTEGNRAAGEVVFCHRASRTLLLCDLAMNIGPGEPWWTRQFFRLNGAYGRLSCSRLYRMLTRDRAAMRASIERICAWDFDRILVCHGEAAAGGPAALRAACAGL
ncbi:MAG: hypothetical protein R3F30_15560 [Planctomycetota bacterium]